MVSSAGDLVDFLRTLQPGQDVTVIVSGDIQLSDEDLRTSEPELIRRGHKVVLKGKALNGRRPTLWIQYKGSSESWNGLVIAATEKVELSGLRVIADIHDNALKMTGIQLREAKEYLIQDCEFIQGNWLPESALSTLAVDTGTQLLPRVKFKQCAFLGAWQLGHGSPGSPESVHLVEAQGGQDAVTVRGAASVHAENCAFGPHQSLFRFMKDRSDLELVHCTALAGDEWALVHLEGHARCDLDAQFCFFGRGSPPPVRGMESAKWASLFRQGDTVEPLVKGRQNGYWNLDAIRVQAAAREDSSDVPANRFPGPPDQVLNPFEPKGVDDRVLPPEVRPWKEKDPLAPRDRDLEGPDLQAVFRLDVTLPNLRCGTKQLEMVGLQDSPWGPLYGTLPPANPATPPPVVRKDKVVDPTRPTGAGLYKTLAMALGEAKSGDVILIRHTGRLEVSSAQLIKSGLNLTIKADEGYRPVLVLDKSFPDRNATLFRVQDGHLTLEDLEFLLQPTQDKFDSRSVAVLVGDGTVRFHNCVVTLEGARRTPLAVVTLPDPKDTLPPTGSRDGTGPRVAFDTCFVRGEGDLVGLRPSRPCGLEVKKSLIALTGSLLNVENPGGDVPSAGLSQRVVLNLNRVTTYLGGHLVRLRAVDPKSLVPVRVEQAVSCLFVSAEPEGKALIHLEGFRLPNKDMVKDRLTWKGEHNYYSSNFMNMLDQQPNDSEMPLEAITQERWKVFAESDCKFVPIKFADPLLSVVPAPARPRDSFRIDSIPQDVGANLEDLPFSASDGGER